MHLLIITTIVKDTVPAPAVVSMLSSSCHTHPVFKLAGGQLFFGIRQIKIG